MIKVDVRGIDEVKRKLAAIPREVRDKALRPALNKVAAKAQAEIARTIPEEFAVKAAEVRSAISLRPARGDELRAVIEVFGSARRRGRSLNLVHFLAAINKMKTRGSKAKAGEIKKLEQQLGFLIKKGGGLKAIQGAFLGNKGRTVFERVGKGRLPIKPVQVIGYSQMFTSRKISRRVMDKVRSELPVEIDRALAMLKARGIL
jgi:hypothetical protein